MPKPEQGILHAKAWTKFLPFLQLHLSGDTQQSKNEWETFVVKMIMNEAASTRFSEWVKIEHEAYMRG